MNLAFTMQKFQDWFTQQWVIFSGRKINPGNEIWLIGPLEIYIENGKFQTALNYKKINEKYPLQHFCGNAFAADEIYNAKQYARIYIGLGEKEKALTYLLPHIFNNGLANNSDLVDLTIETLNSTYGKSMVKLNFENSIKNISSKIEKNRDNEWLNYYIRFFETEIEIRSGTLDFETNNESVESELENTIRASEFYKKLNK